MTALLSIKDMVAGYGQLQIIKGISFEVEEGAVVAIIGPNGAGKTTTLRAISGLNRPTSGQIWFAGKRVDGLPPQDIVKLGIAQVPEGRRLFPHMSVLDNLYMGAFLRKDKTAIEKNLKTVFGHFRILENRKKQYAGSLSGGEQQMLAIGRAIMSNPHILLLDEPSLGLAPHLVAEIGKIIKDISQAGVSVLLVEQNVILALKLAQKAYVLERGNIVLQGTGDELLDNQQVKKTYLGH